MSLCVVTCMGEYVAACCNMHGGIMLLHVVTCMKELV